MPVFTFSLRIISMKNVTLSLSDSVHKLLRMSAAKEEKSISKYLEEIVLKLLGEKDEYMKKTEAFLADPFRINSKGVKFSREEIYDRKIFR